MKCLIVSNMYPNERYPYYGTFVKATTKQMIENGINCRLSVMHFSGNSIIKIVNYFHFYLKTFILCLLGRYDYIYVHYASHSSIPVLFAHRLKKNRVIVNVHGSDVIPDNENQLKFQKYTKRILSIAEKIVVPSEYFKEIVLEKYNINNPECIYIYPSGGVNSKVFYSYDKTKKNSIREKYKISEDKYVIGYVGRIIDGKGWKTYIEAISKIDDVVAFFVGNGPDEELYNKLIEELSLTSKIIKLDLSSQETLCEIYNILDLFVFPTEREGESLGLVAFEAMVCGAIPVCSNFAAPKYYIKHGVNGLKFNVKDVDDLARVVNEWKRLDDDSKNTILCNSLETAQNYMDVTVKNIINEIFFK